VADGCRGGVWHDHSYKHVAYGLAGRGLVRVSSRRNSWTATLTDEGTYYAEHRRFRPPEFPQPDPAISAPQAWRQSAAAHMPLVTPASLLEDLQTADGILTIPDRASHVRAAYRSAISKAITGGLVPGGYGLRDTGRDRGDLNPAQ
jgi:hypothetical protein